MVCFGSFKLGSLCMQNMSMDSDPYDGFLQALQALVRSAAPRIETDVDDAPGIAEEVVYHIESELEAMARRAWNSRASLERRKGIEHSSAFMPFEALLACAHAVGQMLQTSAADTFRANRPPEVVQYAVTLLLTRVVRVGHEIYALLRAGFPDGANARWRTLYELDVVAHVLRRGNRGTAARYINHRWIMARRARDYVDDGSDRSREIERKCREFCRRYGAVYNSPYGWAAEICKRKLNEGRPQFWHLEKLAGLSGHDVHLPAAHQSVHADSLGSLQTVNANGLLHSGTMYEYVDAVTSQTVYTFGEAIGGLIAMWRNYGGTPDLVAIQALWIELSMTLYSETIRTPVVPDAVAAPEVGPATP